VFLTLSEVCAALSLDSPAFDLNLTGVSTDTRTIKPGNLFVALVGANFDGHDYVSRAFELGAAAAVVGRSLKSDLGLVLVVSDTLHAYGNIASCWRGRFHIPVVAVTGSVAKTTTKEMLACALDSLGSVLKSELNENNEVGVPQTLLRLNSGHRAAVIEMGMRGPGQIKYLAELVKPTIGIVTMIGESHIEILGSRDAIADAKGELLQSLPAGSTALLNKDDIYFERLSRKTSGDIRTFGRSVGADVRVASDVRGKDGRQIQLEVTSETYLLNIHSPAGHDAVNAAGAVAVAIAAGVPAGRAVDGLERYRPSHMRMEILRSRSGGTILSDCYNAAPSSLKSALQTLAEMECSGKKSAFLGDMRELGDYSRQMHAEIHEEATRLEIDEVYSIGEAMTAAFPNKHAAFANSAEAAEYVAESFKLKADDIALVKGSRALELEKVVEALVRL
jgi:UDP-N-acetylmuramoyl-tripeptide--D-alanyl-D-alanine ligase